MKPLEAAGRMATVRRVSAGAARRRNIILQARFAERFGSAPGNKDAVL